MLIWGLLICVGIIYQNPVEAWDVGHHRHSLKNLENSLETICQWKYLDYDFSSEELRQGSIRSGAYNRSNINLLDVDYWNGKLFVTTVSAPGVPASLSVVSDKSGPGGPLLEPYPDWSWHLGRDCSGITSVYRVAIDKCDRMWILDTGVVGQTRKCPAQMLVFNLHTSTLLERIPIPDNIAINATTGQGLLVTPIVETAGHNCHSTYVYIADARGNALIVYDGYTFKRFTSGAFDFDPPRRTFTILGQSFDLPDGPVGMALSPITHNLYFSPMASYNLDSVDTRQLKYFANDEVQYSVYRNVLTTQATAKAISKHGTLFFGLVSNTAIGCWNEFNELTPENIDLVAQNPVTLQIPSGMKIKECNGEEVLLTVSNRFQRLATGTLDFNDVNYRVLTGNVEQLVYGTCCQPPRFP